MPAVRQGIPRWQRDQEASRGLRVVVGQVDLQLPHLRDRVRNRAPPQRPLRAALQTGVEGEAHKH